MAAITVGVEKLVFAGAKSDECRQFLGG